MCIQFSGRLAKQVFFDESVVDATSPARAYNSGGEAAQDLCRGNQFRILGGQPASPGWASSRRQHLGRTKDAEHRTDTAYVSTESRLWNNVGRGGPVFGFMVFFRNKTPWLDVGYPKQDRWPAACSFPKFSAEKITHAYNTTLLRARVKQNRSHHAYPQQQQQQQQFLSTNLPIAVSRSHTTHTHTHTHLSRRQSTPRPRRGRATRTPATGTPAGTRPPPPAPRRKAPSPSPRA